jgi:hypothetical protein
MNKVAIICKLHEIIDHYLLLPGNWPARACTHKRRDVDLWGILLQKCVEGCREQ